jgi:hypothetical protein
MHPSFALLAMISLAFHFAIDLEMAPLATMEAVSGLLFLVTLQRLWVFIMYLLLAFAC